MCHETFRTKKYTGTFKHDAKTQLEVSEAEHHTNDI
jgi:hypothetical protein